MKNTIEIKYIFQMLNSTLTGAVLPLPNSELDWKWIYEICKKHRITNIVAYAVEKLDSDVSVPLEIRQEFILAKKKAMAREIVQYLELGRILDEFEKRGIENIPLKGSILKNYYPSPDMRFLTDLDILYHEEQEEQVHEAMTSLEYETVHTGGYHDMYVKRPYMTVETHRTCFSKESPFRKLMENVWKESEKKEGYEYSYVMSWERYYIYMVGHMAKHFQGGGIGIRMLLDLLVFEEKLLDKCNRSYIEKELQKVGILKFEQTMRKKLRKWMDNATPLSDQDPLLDCVLYSGAYGTRRNFSGNQLLVEGVSKRKIFKRWWITLGRILFPKLEGMQTLYPCLKKCPILLPVFWIIRWIHKGVTKPIFCLKHLKNMLNCKELGRMKEVVKEAGLGRGEKDDVL